MSGQSAPIRVRVRNFLGIRRADLELRGLVLVGGQNGSGKSSLLEAVASGAIASPLARGQTTKKAAAALLHRGEAAGSIMVECGASATRISYPDAAIERTGPGEFLGSPLGLGSARFMALDAKDRGREIADRFQTEPTRADLTAWFAAHPGAEMDQEAIGALWARIEMSGWDAVAKDIATHGTQITGAWQKITGQRWGHAKAATWCPPILFADEVYDYDAAVREEAEAAADVERLVGQSAISANEIERLRALAAQLPELIAKDRASAAEHAALSEQMEGLRNRQATLRAAGADDAPAYDCPACRAKLRISELQSGGYSLRIAPPPVPAAKQASALAAAQEVGEQIRVLRDRIDQIARDLLINGRTREEAERAAAALPEMEKAPLINQEALDGARRRHLECSRKAEAIKVLDEARSAYGLWKRNCALLEACDPQGVRKSVLGRKLSQINAVLGGLAAHAKFGAIELTEELDALYDGRPYALLSESERWRVDLVIAAALGRQEGARLLLVDRFDVLHAQARPGALQMLAGLKIPVLIAATARQAEDLPQLTKMRLGTAQWLTAGVLDSAA
jgi:hypothetical protein